MDGIQSESALPRDSTLSQIYTSSFTRICAEFEIPPSIDFRFIGGDNDGLVSVFIYASCVGPEADQSLSYPVRKRFSDERGKTIKGDFIYFIMNDNVIVERQSDLFMVDKSEGLTHRGIRLL